MTKDYEKKVTEAVDAIDEEIARLQAMRNAIAGNVKQTANILALQDEIGDERSPVRMGRKPGRPASGSADSDNQAILEFLRNHKNVRAEEIKAATGIEGRTLTRRLGDLVKAKQIRKQGERRGTTYFPH